MTPSSPEQPCELGIERNPRGGVQVSHLLSLAPIPGPGRDAGFASAHALGLAQGPGKDEGEERGLGKGAEGEEGERRRQHPRGGAASPTVGAPFLLQLLHLLEAEPGTLVDAEISQNFLHSLCVRVLHGWGREQQMVPCLASSSSLSSSSAAAGAAARPLLSPHHPRAITIDPLPQPRSPSTPLSSRRRPGGAGKKLKKKKGKAALKKKIKSPHPLPPLTPPREPSRLSGGDEGLRAGSAWASGAAVASGPVPAEMGRVQVAERPLRSPQRLRATPGNGGR